MKTDIKKLTGSKSSDNTDKSPATKKLQEETAATQQILTKPIIKTGIAAKQFSEKISDFTKTAARKSFERQRPTMNHYMTKK